MFRTHKIRHLECFVPETKADDNLTNCFVALAFFCVFLAMLCFWLAWDRSNIIKAQSQPVLIKSELTEAEIAGLNIIPVIREKKVAR